MKNAKIDPLPAVKTPAQDPKARLEELRIEACEHLENAASVFDDAAKTMRWRAKQIKEGMFTPEYDETELIGDAISHASSNVFGNLRLNTLARFMKRIAIVKEKIRAAQ